MLKDTDLEEILHDGVVEDPTDAVIFLNALDFVVKEWNEAMDSFDVEGQDEVAMKIYGDLMESRMLFVDLMETYSNDKIVIISNICFTILTLS